jgi:HlyD family secretion protein
LAGTELDNLPKGAHVIPGMTLTAEIKVGSRTVMGFFLNPLTRALGESIREP